MRPHAHCKHPFAIVALLFMLALTGTASADPLDDAKRAGSVGEQPDGYLGVVDPPASAAVRALVDDINARRRSSYQAIADRNDIELEAVELLGGQRAIEKSAAGAWVRMADGSWRRK